MKRGFEPHVATCRQYLLSCRRGDGRGVLKMIRQCHIRKCSIYVRQLDVGQHYLFSHFEYTGSDSAVDMARMAGVPKTQRWWSICKPCQQPLAQRGADEGWCGMEEVFHCD